MTTIAFDGRYLAADTLMVRGGNRSEQPLCKLAACDGFAYAFGGQWWAIAKELIARGRRLPDPKGLEGVMVTVQASSRQASVITSDVPYPDLEAAPIGFGTGGDIALGAMGAGVTAMEAVKLAMRWDLKTGGEVDFIDVEWLDKGVQRWDGVMPSAKFPMPVNDGIVRDTHGTLIRDYVKFETTSSLQAHDGAFTVTGNGRTARRVSETMLLDDPDDPDPNPERSRRSVAELFHKVPETRQTCDHGMKPDTYSTCRSNRTENLYPV